MFESSKISIISLVLKRIREKIKAFLHHLTEHLLKQSFANLIILGLLGKYFMLYLIHTLFYIFT